MNPKSQIVKSLQKIIHSTGLVRQYSPQAGQAGVKDIKLEVPEREEFGDYSTNISLQFKSQSSKIESKSQKLKIGENDTPRQIAEKIVVQLKKNKKLMQIVDKIEAAGPGFINFYLKTDVLLNNLTQIVSDPENYGKSDLYKNKKVCVEYTDPNPFKEFHIGHLISNLTGESICRIFEANGAVVWRADYFGDVGVHVAKSILGIQKKMKEDGVTIDDLGKKGLLDRIAYMGAGYAMGSRAYDEDENVKIEIGKLNTILYLCAQKMGESQGQISTINYNPEKKISDEAINAVYDLYVKGRSWSLEYFETIYERLGTKFDGYYPESVVGEIGYRLVKENVGKVFEESEGAVVFKGEKFGLHTRVFINKHNLPTYEAKELGLAPAKYRDFAYDKSVIVVGKEIKEYFAVLVQALKLVEPKQGNVTQPLCTGMISVPGGKMGSRFGNVVTVTELLDQLKNMIEEKYLSTGYSNKEKEDISEKVSQGALKFAFLKNSIGSDFVFDINASVSLEGNSGPYLQYTYARTRSVLAKSKLKNPSYALRASAGWQKSKNETNKLSGAKKIESNHLTIQQFNNEELSLLRQLSHYPDVIVMSVKNYSPNLICTYLHELAQRFNTFYNKHRILDLKPTANDLQPTTQRDFRIALTRATGTVLENGLYLLGIQSPDRM